MREKQTGQTWTYRPWIENQKRLEYAQELGLNVSELVNLCLQDSLRTHIMKAKDAKTKQLQTALAAPVP